MALELIAEDGTIVAGANSYVTLAEFAAYADAHLYSEAYATADDTKRAKALAQATRTIDALMYFNGIRSGADQRLEWPRAGAPRHGSGYWRMNAIPEPLKSATMELAMDLLAGNRLADAATAGIKKLGVGQGALEIEFDPADRPNALTDITIRYLEPLGRLRGRGGNVPVTRA